jgi:hypothetical protein
MVCFPLSKAIIGGDYGTENKIYNYRFGWFLYCMPFSFYTGNEPTTGVA